MRASSSTSHLGALKSGEIVAQRQKGSASYIRSATSTLAHLEARTTYPRLPYDSIVISTPLIRRSSSDDDLLAPWKGSELDASSEQNSLVIIGDTHGCCDDLEYLLSELGFNIKWKETDGRRSVQVSGQDYKIVLLGDYVDRGPRIMDTLRLAMHIQECGKGYALIGNHDLRLLRYLSGYPIELRPGVDASIAQLSKEPGAEVRKVVFFLETLPSIIQFDNGRLRVSHTGMDALTDAESKDLHLSAIRGKQRVTRPCTQPPNKVADTGEDRLKEPEKHWTGSYSGSATVVYGHYQVADVRWVSNTICIDSACVFGGELSALHWPTGVVSSVRSKKVAFKTTGSSRPLPAGSATFVTPT